MDKDAFKALIESMIVGTGEETSFAMTTEQRLELVSFLLTTEEEEDNDGQIVFYSGLYRAEDGTLLPDLLDEIVEGRTVKNPAFPELMKEAAERRR